MELTGVPPVSGAATDRARANEPVYPVPDLSRDDETAMPMNSRLPAAGVLDLGGGVEPPIYAEYTGDSILHLVSIKIVDPSTGGVIREVPYDDVIQFSQAAESYAELGRRHRSLSPPPGPSG